VVRWLLGAWDDEG